MTLDEKIRDVLARLSTLSEASASNLEPRTSHGKSSSKAPAGVSRRIDPTDPNRPPSKERSLFDWYVWKFAHTAPDNYDELLTLWLMAERDFHARSRQGPTTPTLAERRASLRAGKHLEREDEDDQADEKIPAWPAPAPNQTFAAETNRSADDEKEAAQQVIDLYEGVRAEEAAVFERVPIQVIWKARKQHKRNPDDGRPRPPFLDWDDQERRRQIRLMLDQAKQRGEILGAKALGQHFGVAKNTVRPYLEPMSVAA